MRRCSCNGHRGRPAGPGRRGHRAAEIPGRIDTTNQLERLFPELAAEWHPSRNPGIKPYEFPAMSGALVWWRDAGGREWQERIRDRVLAATTLRADGDAHPYG